jgi:predicted transcriptional regulator
MLDFKEDFLERVVRLIELSNSPERKKLSYHNDPINSFLINKGFVHSNNNVNSANFHYDTIELTEKGKLIVKELKELIL